ncbi:hypothetical protein [Natronobacterium gregoryi]|uniref:Uncharacterized protein n=2 Tax=Natronobacterium gregoryi TaxID=44930 RepID=L0AL63_NATGS|nr:hypothetical protein [Natronobacterium gregoryi]AFZ74179.1 hypothetical protein Natgr_3045 [Natronobacterium gregoryi SP2]ELY63635.1 hypothetical protein C490_15334 [Natronobacterium gregoryi SP2]PLK22028.1 hypothetical protein CYV19_01145 [Natronobacterium gregoryi SP2]SFI50968.1 hypothetical protein SAMN05443661_10165 [Natronobacterium gregoryi]
MSEQEIDQTEQLQRVGIGLVLGGIVFGGLSFGVDALVGGIVLLVAGVAVWWREYRRELTIGIGLGIGVAGVVVLIETGADTGFSNNFLAAALVVGGVVDYLLAPAYGRLQDAGERTVGR